MVSNLLDIHKNVLLITFCENIARMPRIKSRKNTLTENLSPTLTAGQDWRKREKAAFRINARGKISRKEHAYEGGNLSY